MEFNEGYSTAVRSSLRSIVYPVSFETFLKNAKEEFMSKFEDLRTDATQGLNSPNNKGLMLKDADGK
jgi:hypothetical protein